MYTWKIYHCKWRTRYLHTAFLGPPLPRPHKIYNLRSANKVVNCLLSATDEGLRRYSVGIFALLGHPQWKTCQALPENKHHQQHKKRNKSVSLHGFRTLCQFLLLVSTCPEEQRRRIIHFWLSYLPFNKGRLCYDGVNQEIMTVILTVLFRLQPKVRKTDFTDENHTLSREQRKASSWILIKTLTYRF